MRRGFQESDLCEMVLTPLRVHGRSEGRSQTRPRVKEFDDKAKAIDQLNVKCKN